MREALCPRDAETAAAAARHGRPDVLSHVRECPSCALTRHVATRLQRLAAVDAHHEMPDPGMIWWKSELRRRWENQTRVEQPLDVMSWIQLVVGSLAMLIIALLQFPTVARLGGLVVGIAPAPLWSVASQWMLAVFGIVTVTGVVVSISVGIILRFFVATRTRE